MHALVDAKQAEIVEDAIADFALEVALFRGHVFVHVEGELVAFAKFLAADVAYVKAKVVLVLHVRYDRLGFAADWFFCIRGFAYETDVHVAETVYNLKRKKNTVVLH